MGHYGPLVQTIDDVVPPVVVVVVDGVPRLHETYGGELLMVQPGVVVVVA